MTYRIILEMAISGIIPCLIIAITIYFIYYLLHKHHSWTIGFMILYLSMLFYVTIYRYGIQYQELLMARPNINFIPLISTFKLYENGGWIIFLYNLLGNIIWFVPFGMLLPAIKKNFTSREIILYSFLLSLSIEIIQFILNCGISDIDDIIFNTIGGGIGYAIYRIINKFTKNKEET